MKIVNILLVIVSALFFPGQVYSGSSSALMHALKSPQAEILSGDQGVSIIFVQSRDGISTVRNVEALGTLYLLSRQGVDQTLVFETDKTNKPLYLLRYRLVDSIWLETEIYNPADLPNIDFQKAHRLVKKQSGKHKAIASIAIFYNLYPKALIVSFQIKGDAEEFCEQWQYHVATKEVWQTAHETKCFFDMDE
jgi:hypothetical protein